MKVRLLAITVALMILGCAEDKVRINIDPNVQAKADSIKIMEYLVAKGYTENQIGEGVNGVRYVILDSGAMNTVGKIDESDLVDFHYTGKTLGDTIFDTSIKSIGDSLKTHYEKNPYIFDGDTANVFTTVRETPFFITYSSSAWTIPQGNSGFIVGFANGIAATFKHLRVNGKALILIPSDQAYGQRRQGVFIGENTSIVFELQPVTVVKQ